MTITPDGIRAAATQEKTLHPTKANGQPITAWERRATTLEETIAEVNLVGMELDAVIGGGQWAPWNV